MKQTAWVWVMPTSKVRYENRPEWVQALYENGWDDLTEEDKQGMILSAHNTGGVIAIDVYWPGLHCASLNVFIDEVDQIKPIIRDYYL